LIAADRSAIEAATNRELMAFKKYADFELLKLTQLKVSIFHHFPFKG